MGVLMFKSQEEFRMNSKKIISSVSLATAVLATGIISQEAHADSVDNTTTTFYGVNCVNFIPILWLLVYFHESFIFLNIDIKGFVSIEYL